MKMFCLLMLLAAGVSAQTVLTAGAGSRPNVLLFLTDDLDFDEVNFYDNESFPCHTGMKARGGYDGKPDQGDYFENPRMLMPNIDQFASDGLVFDRFYVSSAVCMPSRYTFMTGRLASRNPVLRNEEMANVRNGRVRLDSVESNLPKALQAAGYRTGIVGKWHLGHEVAEGTENLRELDYTAPGANAKLTERMRKISENFKAYGFDFAESIFLGNPGSDAVPKAVCSENLEWVTQGALNFLDGQQKGGKPFYLYLSIQNPHNQFYDSKVRSRGTDPTPWLHKDPKNTPGGVMDHEPTSMPSRPDVMRRVAEAGLPPENAQATRIDDSFGAVMKKLKERGLLDNTIVILTTDHQSRGKKTVSESNRVLFVLYWKGHIQAGRTDAICSTPDLIKTILDWAQVSDAPEDVGMDGVSMAKLVADPVANPVVRDSILLECQYPRAVVTPSWKYIAARAPDEVVKRMEADAIRAEKEGTRRRVSWAGEDNAKQKFSKGVKNDSDRDFPGYFDPDQLYDLERDPFEQNNLVNNPEYKTVLAEMKETMESYLVTMPQEFGEFTEGRMSAGQTLKEIMLEQVRKDATTLTPKHLRE